MIYLNRRSKVVVARIICLKMACHKTLLVLNSCPSTLYYWFEHRKSDKAALHLDQYYVHVRSSIGSVNRLSTSYSHKNMEKGETFPFSKCADLEVAINC